MRDCSLRGSFLMAQVTLEPAPSDDGLSDYLLGLAPTAQLIFKLRHCQAGPCLDLHWPFY
jgi:hypothetical protein